MKLNDIKAELKGYFIHKNRTYYDLAIKDGENFKLITDNIQYSTLSEQFEITPIRYLIMQINNQLLDPQVHITDLADVLPVIDFEVFELYDNRNKEIDRHKELLESIKGSKSIFGKKKDFKLIYITTHNYLDHHREQKGYYVIKDKEVVPIDSALLDNVDNAVQVADLQELKKALKDDFMNLHFEKYNEECSKWDSLN